MDITLESSVGESFYGAVGVSLDESDEFQQLVGISLDSSVEFDESDEFQQLVGVTLDSSVEFDESTGVTPTSPSLRPLEADSHAAEDEAPFRDHIPVAESTPVKKGR